MNTGCKWWRAAGAALLGLGLLLSGGVLLHATVARATVPMVPCPLPPEEASSLSPTDPLSRTAFLPLVCNDWKSLNWSYRGASLAGYWHTSYESPNACAIVDYLAGIGANSVAVIVTWYQDSLTASTLAPDPQQTPTDESLADIIDYAHAQGLSVMLKPHVDPGTEWRGEIGPDDEAAWFASFEDFVLHYARMAEAHDVELFCLGTEMASMTRGTARQSRWAQLAAQVRQEYGGQITYAAHEYEVLGSETVDPLPPEFWEPFDYAATTVYYGLSPAITPTST